MAKYENYLLSAAHVATNVKHIVDNLEHYKLNPMKLLNPVSSSVIFLAKPYICQYRDELLLLSKDSRYEEMIKILAFIATDVGLSLVLQGPNMQALFSGTTTGLINYHDSQEHPDSEQLSSAVAFIATTLALYSCYKHTQRTDALSLPLIYIPVAALTHLSTKYFVDISVGIYNSLPNLWEKVVATDAMRSKAINITLITEILDNAMLYKILLDNQDENFICIKYTDYEKNLFDKNTLVDPEAFLLTINKKLQNKVTVSLKENISECSGQQDFLICMGEYLQQNTTIESSFDIKQINLIIDESTFTGSIIERICFELEPIGQNNITNHSDF